MKNKIFAVFVASIAFIACTDNNRFVVSGTVKNGAGHTLYFENITTASVVLKDSCKLNSDGRFAFKGQRPEAPDFFRIKLGTQHINIAVDSTEHVKIEADTTDFARTYTVEGSDESKNIRALTMAQLIANEEYNISLKKFRDKQIGLDQFQDEVRNLTSKYKTTAKETIFADPSSAAAYFALFQQINNMLIFDPYDKADSKIYGAVANLWNLHYPDALRTKHLVALFTTSLRAIRENNEQNAVAIQTKEIDSREYFDIALPTINGDTVRLSKVGNDKVILLDFTAMELEETPDRNIQLAQLYKKYFAKGFDIYQVSLDPNVHLWKNAASNLPWISVIDPQSIYSETARKYNVNNIPVSFLIDKKGVVTAKSEKLNDINTELEKILKK